MSLALPCMMSTSPETARLPRGVLVIAGDFRRRMCACTLRSLHRLGGAAPRRALRMAYTPKHGSWLNMAESELAEYRPVNVSIDASLTIATSSEGRRLAPRRNIHNFKAD